MLLFRETGKERASPHRQHPRRALFRPAGVLFMSHCAADPLDSVDPVDPLDSVDPLDPADLPEPTAEPIDPVVLFELIVSADLAAPPR